jgi:hypothetical protein
MRPPRENTWDIVAHRIVIHILAAVEIRTGILSATVNRTRAAEGLDTTEKETEILMAAIAGTGANVEARLLREVDGTHLSIEGEEVIQEVLLEVAAL